MDPKIIQSNLSHMDIPTDVSLTEFLVRKAEKFGNRVAIVDPEKELEVTFNDIISSVRSVSSALWRRGLRKGDVVMVYLPNCVEYVTIMHGVISHGAVLTTCNPSYTPGEISRQLKDSKATFVFTQKDFLDKINKAIELAGVAIKHTFLLDGDASTDTDTSTSYTTLVGDDGEFTPKAGGVSPQTDTALIPYSSGTSGLPKGVKLSHYNLIVATMQITHPEVKIGHEDDVYIAFLPFYHMYAIILFLSVCLATGSKIIIMKAFDPVKYLTYIAKYEATTLHIVPPVAVMLAKHPAVDQFDVSSVREVIVGAAPLAEELSEELQKRLKLECIRQGYGMTELSPMATVATPQLCKHGSSGVTVANTEIKVIDLNTKQPLGTDCRGEVCVRGPQVMLGYLNNPTATDETIDTDGWLHTGDIGYYDQDENFYIVDRIKELIKYKAFQVAPAELEDLLVTHPCVLDCAVIGIPDERAGELPRAYIILKPDTHCTDQQIHHFVNENVAAYKQLRGGIEFVKEIPKSPSGKILRRFIRDAYAKQSKEKA